MTETQTTVPAHRLEISDHSVGRRRKFVGLTDEDIVRIKSVRDLVLRRVDEFTAEFFNYLGQIEEAASLVNRHDWLVMAKQLKREHLIAMVEGDYGRAYVEQRIKLGMLYSKAGLDSRVFLGAFHHLMTVIGTAIMQSGSTAEDAFRSFLSLKKVAFFDIGIIIDVLIDERERTITLQQDAIRELSTPVLQVRDRLLILPIIGVIDTRRARQLTDALLHAIRANRAKVAVMDITGVAAVDSKVANHLIQTIAAARLMGTRIIVTGLSADVAQALVTLGVDLGTLDTMGDLQGGLEEAERLLGYQTIRLAPTPNQA